MVKKSIYTYGNTTVRNTTRFPEGLRVLEASKYNGNINSKHDELGFAELLNNNDVVEMEADKEPDDSLGRKWRSAFDKTGFITPATVRRNKLLENNGYDPIAQNVKKLYPDLPISGRAYEVTPQGQRLAEANTIYEMQDTILRALLAIQIDSFDVVNTKFKPFVFVLQVMKCLRDFKQKKGINRLELVIVSSCTDHSKAAKIAQDIIKYREGRDKVKGKRAKSKYDREFLSPYADQVNVKYDTAVTYEDPNFKYMLSTGIFSRQGRRLIFNKEHQDVIDEILKSEPHIINNTEEYYYNLWKGYPLPTDNREILVAEIQKLAAKLNVKLSSDKLKASIPDLKQLEIQLEMQDGQIREKAYAREQDTPENVDNIITYLRVINGEVKSGEEYENARDDMPAFLEWVTWRAFLAIDGLKCKPYEARGFKVDQDFFPAGNAPGGRPDIMLEFDDYVLVVEVTLTSSSRQESAEAEPVRRHVAQIQEKYPDKPVYGLFLAQSIDNNTAEMFRTGLWYKKDEPQFVNIVPMKLSQFIYIMKEFQKNQFSNSKIEALIEKCLIPRIATVPIWKREIDKTIQRYQLA